MGCGSGGCGSGGLNNIANTIRPGAHKVFA